MKNLRHVCGFTLIELVVTVLMAAIILSAGVPSFRNMILNNRQTTQINNLLTSLMIARSEAVKRHSNTVTVCKTSDQVTCTGAGGWEQGWIIFDDVNGSGAVDGAEQLIRFYESFANNGLTLRGNAFVASQVTFLQTGMLAPFSNGTFRVCDARGQTQANGLIISVTGRVTRAVDTNGDGIVEDGGGVPVPCP